MRTIADEPDWDHILSFNVTPAGLIQALFATASDVHTGWSSCVESALTVADIVAKDDRSGNFVRLVEQEFSEDEDPDVLWHDWVVEIRINDVYVTGHWQVETTAPAIDWEFCAREAESAFDKAAVLFGKRIRRVMAVEEQPEAPPPKSKHH